MSREQLIEDLETLAEWKLNAECCNSAFPVSMLHRVCKEAAIALSHPQAASSTQADNDALLRIAELRGIAAHIRAVPDYHKLRGDADCLDRAIETIRRLASSTTPASGGDPWQSSGVDYDRAIHHNPDAGAWAKFFVQTFPGQREQHDLMRAWFANAMMAMHDWLKQQPATRAPVVDEATRDRAHDEAFIAAANFGIPNADEAGAIADAVIAVLTAAQEGAQGERL